MSSWHAGQRPGARRGRLEAFRAWRRSRPFWGGLLMLLAGLELLAIPLSGVLIQGQVKLVIYIGIGGVFGVLIGVLLIAAGIVVWVNPTHRVFYGIVGIILGIASFPASNLGGFFIGMLMAIIGGALAFAWAPGDPSPERRPDRSAGPPDTRVDLPSLMGDDAPRDHRPEENRPGENRRSSGGFGYGSGSGYGGPGYRMLAFAGLPCLIFCASSASPASTSSSSSSTPAASPSASASASSGSAKNAAGQVAQSAAGAVKSATGAAKSATGAVKSAAGKAAKKPAKKNAAKKSVPVNQVQSPSGLLAPSATSVLTAKSSTLTKLNLVGVTTLPVGGGGSQKFLEFTASTASLSSVGITIHQSGHTVLTKTTSLSMPSGMTLYTTKLCGQVEGIAPNLCFTPDTASQAALKVASLLGQAAPITMTNVSASQFINAAGTQQWGGLSLEAVN